MAGLENLPHAPFADLVEDHVVAQHQLLAAAILQLLSLIWGQLLFTNQSIGNINGGSFRDVWCQRLKRALQLARCDQTQTRQLVLKGGPERRRLYNSGICLHSGSPLRTAI